MPTKPRPDMRLSGLVNEHDGFGAGTLVQATYEEGTLTLKLHDIELDDFRQLLANVRTCRNPELHIQLISATL